jgi:predicted phage baseplate assembly protein
LDAHFVVESDDSGVARLRFGDGLAGRDPADAPLWAVYRIGGGPAGNVGAGRLDSLLLRPDGTAPMSGGAVLEVWNPLAASGGQPAETVEQVRRLAPTAYRRQLRAVTDEDYAVVAGEVAGVQRAVSRRRWTGSWYSHEVLVDPVAGRAGDAALPAQVAELLEVRRMAGQDVEVRRPVYVPLRVAIAGCVRAGYVRGDVTRELVEVFSAGRRRDGSAGFFDPDRFTFGQSLYLSDIVAAAMSVAGVAWVEVTWLGRLSDSQARSGANIARGRLTVGPREVLRCDTDANNPEYGRIDITLKGGS